MISITTSTRRPEKLQLTHNAVIIVVVVSQCRHVRVEMLLLCCRLPDLSPAVSLFPFIQLRCTVSMNAVVARTIGSSSSSDTGERAMTIFMSTSAQINSYDVQPHLKHSVSVCCYGTFTTRKKFLSITHSVIWGLADVAILTKCRPWSKK